MATQNQNPFVLPGFGQGGELDQNPMLAGMEMMRQAWENMAKAGGYNPAAMGVPSTPEELDKRIAELRVLENWLRMNLSMLNNTIQALEIQRSTITTLKAFMSSGQASAEQGAAAWGAMMDMSAWPSATGGGGQQAEQSAASSNAGAESDAAAETSEKPSRGTQAKGASTSATDMSPAAAAAQSWWNLLQQQFDTLAAAASASLKGVDAATGGASASSAAPAKKAASRRRSDSDTAARSPARKTAAKRSTASKRKSS